MVFQGTRREKAVRLSWSSSLVTCFCLTQTVELQDKGDGNRLKGTHEFGSGVHLRVFPIVGICNIGNGSCRFCFYCGIEASATPLDLRQNAQWKAAKCGFLPFIVWIVHPMRMSSMLIFPWTLGSSRKAAILAIYSAVLP